MAKLDHMPQRSIILGFKGKLDFYTWKGIPVVRKWPYTPRSHLTENTRSQWPDFGYLMHEYAGRTPSIDNALYGMVEGTQQAPRDVAIDLYYNKTVTLTQITE